MPAPWARCGALSDDYGDTDGVRPRFMPLVDGHEGDGDCDGRLLRRWRNGHRLRDRRRRPRRLPRLRLRLLCIQCRAPFPPGFQPLPGESLEYGLRDRDCLPGAQRGVPVAPTTGWANGWARALGGPIVAAAETMMDVVIHGMGFRGSVMLESKQVPSLSAPSPPAITYMAGEG